MRQHACFGDFQENFRHFGKPFPIALEQHILGCLQRGLNLMPGIFVNRLVGRYLTQSWTRHAHQSHPSINFAIFYETYPTICQFLTMLPVSRWCNPSFGAKVIHITPGHGDYPPI
jgi:hypothetical protein